MIRYNHRIDERKLDKAEEDIRSGKTATAEDLNNFGGNVNICKGAVRKQQNNNRIGTCTATDIKNYIDNYRYAMVYLSGSGSNHFMFFSGYNNTGDTLADTFYVYDPAASTYTTGANVLPSKTTSGYKSKTYSSVIYNFI